MRIFLSLTIAIVFILSISSCGKEKHLSDTDITVSSTRSEIESTNSTELSTVSSEVEDNHATMSSTEDTISIAQSSSITQKPNSSTSKLNESSQSNTTSKSTVTTGEYTVTFDLGYESKSFVEKSQNYKVAKPQDPTRSGYKFLYWYVKGSGNEWDFFGHAVTDNMTLTAKWGKYYYHINYDISSTLQNSNIIAYCEGTSLAVDTGDISLDNWKTMVALGGTAGKEIYAFELPSTYTVDSESFTISGLSIPNYTFLGWTYEGQSAPVKAVTIPKGTTKNYNLVAHWQKNE